MATNKPPGRPGHHVATNKPLGKTGHHVATNKPPGGPDHHVATNKPPGKPGHHVAPNKPPGKPGHHVAPNKHPVKPGHHVAPNKPPGKPGHHVAPNNLRVNLSITRRLTQSYPYSHVLSQQYHIRVIPQNLKVHFFKTIVFQGGLQPQFTYPKYSNTTDSSTNSVQLPNSKNVNKIHMK